MLSHKKRNKHAILVGASSTVPVALAVVVLATAFASTSIMKSIYSASSLPSFVQKAYGDDVNNKNRIVDEDDEHTAIQPGTNNGEGNFGEARKSTIGSDVNSGAALLDGNQQRVAPRVDNSGAANTAADNDDDRGNRGRNVRGGSDRNSLAASIGNTVLAGTIAAIIGAAAYTAYRIIRVKQKRITLVKGGINNNNSSSNTAPPS
jgi:hypothetical protein